MLLCQLRNREKQQSAYYCYSKQKLIISIVLCDRNNVMFIAFNRKGINLKDNLQKKIMIKRATNYALCFMLFYTFLFGIVFPLTE